MTRYAAMFGVLVWAVLVSSAQAVGLGNITLRSALTEPLDAEIRIVNPDDLDAEELNVRLASAADFNRAGVERPFFLTSLQFEVRTEGDTLVVNVTTDEAVQEPFLDFLVELRWPSGRLIREYTLLLDPPTFAPSDSGQVFPSADPFGATSPEVPEVSAVDQATPVRPTPRQEELSESEYRVQNNDTLWEIALQARRNPSHTPQQIMLAIQDLNPDAFINNNINRIKAGKLLSLPSAEQVEVRNAAEANRDVARQNSGLRGTPPPADTQLTASDDTATGLSGSAEVRDPDGFLEVVTETAAEPDQNAAITGGNQEVARLQNELAIQQELNDELRRQYDDQQTRLNDLEEQLQLLTRLVELQNESAAQLQAAAEQLAQQEAAEGPTPSDDTAAATPTDTLDAEAAAATSDEGITSTTAAAPGDEASAGAVALPIPASGPDLEALTQQRDLVTRLLAWVGQPYNAALVLLALVLVLALTNLTMKRRAAAAEESALEIDDDLLADDEALDEVDQDWAESTAAVESLEEESAPTPAASPAALNPATAAEAIENAELYMAFQRYDEAESALTTALEQAPGEPSLQLKLLELYAETGQRADFEALAATFAGDPAAVAGLRQQLDSAVLRDSGEALEQDEDFGDLEDLDLSFDDEEEEGSTTAADAPHSPGLGSSELSDELSGLDLPDLDLPDLDIPELDVPDMVAGQSFEESAGHRAGSGHQPATARDPQANEVEFASVEPASEGEQETPAAIEDDHLMDFDFSDVDVERPEDKLAETRTSNESTLDDDFDLDAELAELHDDFADEEPVPKAGPTGESVAMASDLDNLADDFNLDEFSEDLALDELGSDEVGLPGGETPEQGAAAIGASTDLDDPLWSEPADALAEDAADSDFAPQAIEDEEDWDDDFDFLEGSDEVATKLDLARAYVDMEDVEGARDILNEVVEEGDEQQVADAKTLLDALG